MNTRWTALPLAALCAMLSFWLPTAAQAQLNFGTISEARSNTIDPYVPDNLGQAWQVTGRVSSVDFKSTFGGTNWVTIYFQDPVDNAGLLLFFPTNLEPSFVSANLGTGKQIRVAGFIEQTDFGVTTIRPNVPSINIEITDPTEVGLTPLSMTLSDLLADPESYEATFVSVEDATITSGTWPSLGNSGNVTINDGTASLTMRIESSTNLDGQLPPTNAFTVQGIFSQFDTSAAPKDAGYQILPRFYTDVIQDVGDVPPEIVITPTNRIVGAGQAAVFNLLGQDRNAEDVLTFSAPDAPPGTIITPLPDRQADLSWTPGAGFEGTTNVFDVIVSDGANEATGTVQVIVLSEELANIVLNEVHFDPAPGLAGDANGDGFRDALLDEFVEIVNNNMHPVDMSGWTFWYNNNMTYTIPADTVIPGQAALVLFGGPTPVGTFGGATVLWGTNTWPNLGNNGGVISLRTTDGTPVFDVNYNTFGGFAGGNTDQSLTLNPDVTGDWGLHTDANPSLLWSPGLRVDGTPFPGSTLTNTPPVLTLPADSVVRIGESITLNVSGVDPEDDPFTLDVLGAPATAQFTDNGDGTGSLVYTGQLADAGTVFTLTFTADDTFGVSSNSTTLAVPSLQYNGLIINEYLANPIASPGGFDANNDGVLDASDDEYVEIVNNTTGTVNLAGMMIWDDNSLRHVFDPFELPQGGVIVVFGGGSLTNFTASPAVTASQGTLGLRNSFDSIRLFTPSTTLVDRVDYVGSALGSSETRFPDITGSFTNHMVLNGQPGSPGRMVDGTPFLTNQPPSLQPIGNQTVEVGKTLDLLVVAIESDGDLVTMTVSNAPANSSFIDNGDGTADFSFTPDPTQVGDHEVTFIASDVDGSDQATITISVIFVALGPWDFETDLQGWTPYSRASNRDWVRGSIGGGAEGTTWYMEMNGFGGDEASDDWLISPALNLAEMDWIDAELRYWRQYGFSGPVSDLVLYASTEYTGEGDPLDVTWDVVREVSQPDAQNSWAEETADLTPYLSSTNLYLAFRYISSGTGGGEARRWRVDQIYLEGIAANQPPVLDPIANQVVFLGDVLNLPLSASEADGDLVTMTVSNAPANSTFIDNGDGTADFAFTPDATQVGSYEVTFIASDKDGADQVTITITVTTEELGPWDFESGLQGWMPFSRASNRDWTRQSADGGAEGTLWYMQMDGFGADEASDDWLISPALDMESRGWTDAQLRYFRHYAFGGPVSSLVLYASTDYTGAGDPLDATWAVVQDVALPAAQNVWEEETADLTSYLSETSLYLAFRYITSGTGGGQARRWRVDQIYLEGTSAGDVDTDGDGIPDWWELENFGSITGAVATAVAANGVNTVLETYIADLDPNDPDSVFALTVEVDGSSIEITFDSSSARLYTTQYTTNLEEDPQVWIDLETDVPGTGDEKTVVDPSGDVHRAYRARVRLP